ncbi:unnamed protein product [Rotaria sordida]|uniref:Uncharacterized protein n=1 Tax=Rotaria sordida TaxID=392033 RepID=A0A819JP69_9BILA|nr:unnamed protein product [Rotaria sordida]
MKAQLFTFMLFTIGVLLFQSAYTYHFRKRELTEYDLTSFIVNTCSADKIELLIQNLCDQTLQSALMGALMSRRFVRSLYKKNELYQNREETDTDIDLKQKMILEICMTSTEKNSIETHRFCNQTLKDIQRGRYPEIKRLCKSYPGFNYCQRILSFSSLLSEPLSKESSSLLSSLPSTTPNIYRSSVPLEFSKSSDVESIIDQQRMNKSPLS